MTKLLEQALEAARKLSRDDQDEIARAIFELVGAGAVAPVLLTADERVAIERSRAAALRGEFASEKNVAAVWAKHGA
ncbi:hypothetical protein WHT83_13065 [Aminobacter sp. P9b]|uniref:Addiction module component n=1 Tax=Aminobacter niigataensis TaxID=83265 RepID=A0ABR6L1F1_9HYPH|nr:MULTISPECIES: hypothetical protein [Aminobacter]AWC24614.1 hypothetical protein CO731_04103 [Aminobacter sp. MSH1]MBB4650024.1 hypothetical protein [Aminobacter niigataensis]